MEGKIYKIGILKFSKFTSKEKLKKKKKKDKERKKERVAGS